MKADAASSSFASRLRAVLIATVVLAGASGFAGVVALRRVIGQTDERWAHTLFLVDVERAKFYIEEKVATSRAYLLTGEPRYLDELRAERELLLGLLADLRARSPRSEMGRLLAEVSEAEARHQEGLDSLLVARRQSSPANDEVTVAFSRVLKPAR